MRYTKAIVEPILLAGQKMSNLCYNLAQIKEITDKHRLAMKECQEEWDKAYALRRSAPAGKEK